MGYCPGEGTYEMVRGTFAMYARCHERGRRGCPIGLVSASLRRVCQGMDQLLSQPGRVTPDRFESRISLTSILQP